VYGWGGIKLQRIRNCHVFQLVKFSLAIRVLYFNAIVGVIPCEYAKNFTSPVTRIIVPPDAEDRTMIGLSSFFWTKHRNVTDERTSRDGQNSSGYYNGLHCSQRGRAVKTSSRAL